MSTQSKPKKVKEIKAWAVFADEKLVDIWAKRIDCQSFVNLEIKLSSNMEYKVIPVLVLPIKKINKK
jgi:hypothetical protein